MIRQQKKKRKSKQLTKFDKSLWQVSVYVIRALSHSLRDSLLIAGRNSSGSVAYDSTGNKSFKFRVSVAVNSTKHWKNWTWNGERW